MAVKTGGCERTFRLTESVMPRLKAAPLPDMTVHNLRKRAAQLHVIAEAMESKSVREALEARALHLMREADAAEKAGGRESFG